MSLLLTDIEPPEFSFFPQDISVSTDRRKNYAKTSWEKPVAIDNAGFPVVKASLRAPLRRRFYLGDTTITYTAYDGAGLETARTFVVTVVGTYS